MVRYSNEYEIGGVTEFQGSKRLKKANLQDKGILFESDLLQIGYRT